MEIGSVLISFALLTGGGAGVDTGGLGTGGLAVAGGLFVGLIGGGVDRKNSMLGNLE